MQDETPQPVEEASGDIFSGPHPPSKVVSVTLRSSFGETDVLDVPEDQQNALTVLFYDFLNQGIPRV